MLLAGHLLQLLEHLGEAGRRLAVLGALAVTHQRRAGLVERLAGLAHRARHLLPALRALGLRRRFLHLATRIVHHAQRPLRQEVRLGRRLLQPLHRLLDALLQRSLLRTQITGSGAGAGLLLQLVLLASQLQHLLDGLIEFAGEFLLPLAHLLLARLLQVVGGVFHRLRRLLGRRLLVQRSPFWVPCCPAFVGS